MLVFPALHVAMPHIHTIQITDHGARLVEWVAEGSLDSALVAIAGQDGAAEGSDQPNRGGGPDRDPGAGLLRAALDGPTTAGRENRDHLHH